MELGVFIRKTCSEKSTCKYCCISLLFSILSCAFSIIVLCKCFPRIIDIQDKTGFDYIGFIIGVLSLLITIVLGWNIFTVIDTKGEVDKLKEERGKLQEYVKANRNYAIGITNLIDGKYGNAVAFIFSTAVKAHKISDEEILDDCLNHIQRIIDNHIEDMGDSSFLKAIYEETKSDFKKIKDIRVEDISKRIEEIISQKDTKVQ